jgi:hypothetical protein
MKHNVLYIIIPTRKVKRSAKKCSKRQRDKTRVSASYFKKIMTKKELKKENEGKAKSVCKKKSAELPLSRA